MASDRDWTIPFWPDTTVALTAVAFQLVTRSAAATGVRMAIHSIARTPALRHLMPLFRFIRIVRLLVSGNVAPRDSENPWKCVGVLWVQLLLFRGFASSCVRVGILSFNAAVPACLLSLASRGRGTSERSFPAR